MPPSTRAAVAAATTTTAAAISSPSPQKDVKHLDLHGNEFQLPSYTMKEIHDAIPPHCFKPSVLRSMAYVVRDYCYLAVLMYLAVTGIPYLPNQYLRFAAWAAYTTVQGFVFTGIWILAHECGHGAFSKSKKLNYTMGLIMHSFLLVPFHSWRLSHSQHHKATGNIERDTAFVPHDRQSWLSSHLGKKAGANMVEFAELAEDSPMASLWHDLVHQLFGWPGYLLFNLTGQRYKDAKGVPAKGLRISHFYFGEDSVFYKKHELGMILLSDIMVAVMIAALVVAGKAFGSWNVMVLWGVPWLWVNNWIVAITFLQHTDASMPHYDNKTWNFARGATATIDRDLGFIDTHLFHDIIGTHVCHHLVSTIPFYHAGEASQHIKRVMGQHYKADVETPFWTAFWRNQRSCKFIEETDGAQGSGVYFFRNLYNRKGEAQPIHPSKLKLASRVPEEMVEEAKEMVEEAKEMVEAKETKVGAMATAMSSSRNLDARRRLSKSAGASLPILVDA